MLGRCLLALAAEVERRTRSLHEDAEAASVARGVVVVAEEEVAVVGQGQAKWKEEAEVTEAAVEAAEATEDGIKRGKAKTRRDRQITIGSEDTIKK